jgi:flavin-dependent dehydrogenase
MKASSSQKFDVAILGGGIAGSLFALNLKKKHLQFQS